VGTVCACGARGEHANCSSVRSASSSDDTRRPPGDLYEAIVAELPARSANEVARRVGRQRAVVLAAIRRLVSEGAVAKTAAGLEAKSTLLADVRGNGTGPFCVDGRGGCTPVGDDRGGP
jgi:hypothetical protein